MAKRLFIVSNRLPITVDEQNGVQQSSGGLVTAINSYLDKAKTGIFSEIIWAGMPGCNVSRWVTAEKQIDASSFRYLPVFVSRNEYDSYYNGHANSVLWPLFHYFPA